MEGVKKMTEKNWLQTFTRSSSDCWIGGVCGGIGEYLGIDPAWVRLVFVLIALGRGFGLGLYLILWIIIPLEGRR